MTAEKKSPLVFLIAGEPSGDAIGARLMVALRSRHGGDIRFMGLGGEAMISEGLESLFPISEISIMGLLEVLPRLTLVLRRVRETVAAIREAKPHIVVSIDSPAVRIPSMVYRCRYSGLRLLMLSRHSVMAAAARAPPNTVANLRSAC